MSSNVWKKQKIGEIALINMGQSPESEYYNYERIGLPFLQGNRTFGFKYPSYDTFCTKGNKFADPNDILISVRAPVGDLNIARERICIGRGLASLKMKNGNYEYLFYLLKSNIQELINRESGTVFGSINKDDIYNLEVIIAQSDDDQRRIAEILSALDDKIELNRQTNATLEAIAQAIFKEWFINFNFPGGTGEMVESELGMIPKGWRVDSILMVAELLSGGTPSTKINEYWSGDIKWISAKDVSNAQGSFVLDTERKITRLGVKNSSTKILPKLTTIVTARGTVGSYCILSEPMAMNQTNYGLKAKEQESDYFVFFSLANLVAQLQQASYGTIFDTVTTITFEKSKIIIPPYFIIQKFDQLLRPLMGTILGNLEQSNTLSKIRDSILPKLMDGEINV
jgi:type I restriction enzyme S subunit